MNPHLNVAMEIAQQAGSIMRNNFTLGMKKEWKSDSTPLTITDTTVNSLVIDVIGREFPDHAVLGEEESLDREAEYVWVVDPVDGTAPFSHGVPTFVFSLALVQNGIPVTGVIYDPVLDRLLHAEKGQGAFLNNERIHVSDRSAWARSQVNLDTDTIPRLRTKLCDLGAWCSTFNSAVYGGLLVACGEFVAEVYAYDKPWDAAAMKIVIEEAGGKVTGLDGGEQRYDGTINGCVASNGVLHDELIALIRDSR